MPSAPNNPFSSSSSSSPRLSRRRTRHFQSLSDSQAESRCSRSPAPARISRFLGSVLRTPSRSHDPSAHLNSTTTTHLTTASTDTPETDAEQQNTNTERQTEQNMDDDMDLVDGTLVFVPRTMTVTRPSSPTPTMDFSIISPPTPRASVDFSSPTHRGRCHTVHGYSVGASQRCSTRLFPRLWDAFSSPAKKGRKERDRRVSISFGGAGEWTYVRRLSGEEGELIDEACFIDSNGADGDEPTSIDIISLLPPEVSVQLLTHLDLSSILACQTVSRTWHNLADDNAVWRALFYRRAGWTIDLARAAARGWTPPLRAPKPTLDRFLAKGKSPQVPTQPPRRDRAPSTASAPLSPPWSPELLLSHVPPAKDAPLLLHWRALFRARLALDRRWCADGPVRAAELRAHTDSVYCLELDSARIVTGSRDRTIKVWTHAGRCVATLRGHEGSVLCLKFDKDWDVGAEEGRRGFMVSGSSDRTVCVWDLWVERGEVRGEVRAVLRGHAGGVLDLRIDGEWIVSCSKDAVIRVWDRHTLALHRTLVGHEGPVNAVGLQRGQVVSASGDGKMMLWDIESGERLRVFEGHERGLACIEFKGDWIVSGSNDCKIKVWSAATGECLKTLVGHDALVRALAFDPATGRLVSASYDKTVKVWDLRSGRIVIKFTKSHTSHIFDVKFDARRTVRCVFEHGEVRDEVRTALQSDAGGALRRGVDRRCEGRRYRVYGAPACVRSTLYHAANTTLNSMLHHPPIHAFSPSLSAICRHHKTRCVLRYSHGQSPRSSPPRAKSCLLDPFAATMGPCCRRPPSPHTPFPRLPSYDGYIGHDRTSPIIPDSPPAHRHAIILVSPARGFRVPYAQSALLRAPHSRSQ